MKYEVYSSMYRYLGRWRRCVPLPLINMRINMISMIRSELRPGKEDHLDYGVERDDCMVLGIPRRTPCYYYRR